MLYTLKNRKLGYTSPDGMVPFYEPKSQKKYIMPSYEPDDIFPHLRDNTQKLLGPIKIEPIATNLKF